ncbi:MAG: hypothetical protein K0R75_3110, partial [Paenibacillaceae bacterium]|nr:hypothetical protein [Paenibacillaceae bacterium]
KDEGYKGIWYYNQRSNDEYVFKYSGGLGTYPANHIPFAVYRAEVNKTFFCYGGTTESGQLLHMVSYYDHERDVVPRPTILLNKETDDAHDNPVISINEEGYIWIFSTSHGTSRPSYIHRSKNPYDIDQFESVDAVYTVQGKEEAMDNFSYVQVRHVPGQGFVCYFTKYNYPAKRTICFMTSRDGRQWSEWQRLAAIEEGHYQVSNITAGKSATSFNFHPLGQGLNYRTNLYYMETADFGKTWRTVDGKKLELPLTEPINPALVHEYQSEGLKIYTIDLQFDHRGNPVILYIATNGYESGPANGPRTWTIAHWTGDAWEIKPVTTSDSNYDMGSLYIEADVWRIIGPTASGAQPYNPGGEMEMWVSNDEGSTWSKTGTLTANSQFNHTYARRPIDAHSDFYALWADGDCRARSESRIYFSDQAGNARVLPVKMLEDFATPARLDAMNR